MKQCIDCDAEQTFYRWFELHGEQKSSTESSYRKSSSLKFEDVRDINFICRKKKTRRNFKPREEKLVNKEAATENVI